VAFIATFLFMYLQRLEIQGFKSFANPVELVFNRDLTAVVGPNGSGKSNIADAVRWVLGEQSTKNLRSKKSEDIIFAGSDKKHRLGFAQVDMYLNNQDKQADIDFDEIVITRRVERNGDSSYLMNGSKVRLIDVQLLLAKANFGQKTYSIIGQGMIDGILTASAAERKEFFDEATGVRQFQIKKDQAILKLTNSKKNLAQSSQILAELEPRLRSLTRQVNKLEKREKIEEELQILQTNYYSWLKNNLDQDLSVQQTAFSKLQNQVAELNDQLISLQTKLEKEETATGRHESFELLQNKLSQAQTELNSLLKNKTILEGKIDLKLMSSGKSDIVWLKQRRETLDNEVSKNNLKLEEKNKKLVVVESELKVLESKRNAVLAEFTELEKRLAQPDADLSPNKVAKHLDSILLILEDLDKLEDLSKIKKLGQDINKQIKNLVAKFRQPVKDKQITWQSEFNKLLTSKDNLVSEISEAKTKVALLKNDISQINQDVEEDKEELKRLEVDILSYTGKSNGDQPIQEQLKGLQSKIDKQAQAIVDIEKQIKDFNVQEEAKKSSLVKAQQDFRQIQYDFNIKNNELNEIKVALAKLETKQEDLNKEIEEEFSNLAIDKKADKIDVDNTRQQINNLKNQLNIIGGIDQAVVAEYKEVNERYQFLKTQSDDLDQAISHLEKVIKDLDESISAQFDKSFKSINKLFEKYFKKLFNGGKSELLLNIKEIQEEQNQEEDDEEEEEQNKKEVKITKQYGIDIKATPPGKRLSNINMLSGGEKALTSIALICAIIANNPSPFVVLDEVDAALDEANSIRFSEILNELSDRTQFIAITHNRATMQQAKIIYGVTMGDDGISKLLSMNFEDADEIAA
jgi:chromosome segregation protein